MIHPLVAPHAKAIVAALTTRVEGIGRIVLLGSASSGGEFDPETSDIDIAILFDDKPHGKQHAIAEAGNELRRILPAMPQFSVLTTSQVERWRNFELCYEGQVAAGVVLFADERKFDGLVLSRGEAKKV